MKAIEIRNLLSIYDDDELNIACEEEEHEELAEAIAKKIVDVMELPRLYEQPIKFDSLKEVLRSFGFEYIYSDDDHELYYFFNQETKDEISIYPIWYYSVPGTIRLQNFSLS